MECSQFILAVAQEGCELRVGLEYAAVLVDDDDTIPVIVEQGASS